MIEIDIKTLVLVCSSLFPGTALLLNFKIFRRTNRISISSKLAELSKLLSDELVARIEMHRLIQNELEEAKAYPDQTKAVNKIKSLEEALEKSINRQNELDSETEYLNKAFSDLDNVNIGGLDLKIANSYRMQRIAESTLNLADKLRLQ